VIICGHTRWKAAQLLGLAQVPVYIARDLTPAQVKAYRLADNRTNQLSDWDLKLLAGELDALKLEDVDMSDLGFSPEDLEKLLASATSDMPLPRETLTTRWALMIECASESEQKQVYERLTAEGLKCKPLSL
jgi:ParB-like chromosome segregation protein Spo0J